MDEPEVLGIEWSFTLIGGDHKGGEMGEWRSIHVGSENDGLVISGLEV